MAIWLGLLIDGIPESFVIGAGFLTLLSVKLGAGIEPSFTEVLPYTLIAGLFLSNFSEALSASIGMKKNGMSTGKIMIMWMSLVIIIGIGALVGYYIGSSIPHEIEIAIEGLAAGAMLTMIAQIMIPEAVHLGGAKVVGLSTLIGYLSQLRLSYWNKKREPSRRTAPLFLIVRNFPKSIFLYFYSSFQFE
jgi:zinc transporter, ZIP family